MEYKLIEENSAEKLTKSVNDFLSQNIGWKPFESPNIYYKPFREGYIPNYIQAIIKQDLDIK